MKNKLMLFICLVLSTFAILSCKSDPPNVEKIDIRPEITGSQEKIEAAQGQIEDSTYTIEQSAESIKSIVTSLTSFLRKQDIPDILKIESQTTQINEKADVILFENEKIRLLDSQLEESKTQLELALSKFKTVESQIVSLAKERETLIKERDKALRANENATLKLLRWLIISCVIGCGISVALMVYGNFAIGSMLFAGSAGTMGLAIAIEQYFEWIALGGLITIGLAAVYAIYELYKRQKALKEVVETTEIAKRKLPTEERVKVFGYREEPGLAKVIQSEPTERLVNSIRKQMKDSWSHTIDDTDAKSMDEAQKRTSQY